MIETVGQSSQALVQLLELDPETLRRGGRRSSWRWARKGFELRGALTPVAFFFFFFFFLKKKKFAQIPSE